MKRKCRSASAGEEVLRSENEVKAVIRWSVEREGVERRRSIWCARRVLRVARWSLRDSRRGTEPWVTLLTGSSEGGGELKVPSGEVI